MSIDDRLRATEIENRLLRVKLNDLQAYIDAVRESDIEHRRREHQYRVMQFQKTIEPGVLRREAIVYDRESVHSRTKFKQQIIPSFQHPVTQEHTQSSEPFQQPALERNSRHQADVKTTSALPTEERS